MTESLWKDSSQLIVQIDSEPQFHHRKQIGFVIHASRVAGRRMEDEEDSDIGMDNRS